MAVSTWCFRSQFFRVSDIGDAQQLLYFFPTFIGDHGVAMFLIDDEVAGIGLLFTEADLLSPRQTP